MSALATPVIEAPAVTVSKPGVLRRLLRNTSVLIGGVLVLAIMLMGVLAPVLTSADPAAINPSNRNKLPGYETSTASTTTANGWPKSSASPFKDLGHRIPQTRLDASPAADNGCRHCLAGQSDQGIRARGIESFSAPQPVHRCHADWKFARPSGPHRRLGLIEHPAHKPPGGILALRIAWGERPDPALIANLTRACRGRRRCDSPLEIGAILDRAPIVSQLIGPVKTEQGSAGRELVARLLGV